MEYPPLELLVWGKFACFTRPEMKVERVSYEVMTPSAARGVLEAIYWKPEFQWHIQEIRVLKPIRYFSILRNEVKNRIAYATAQHRYEGSMHYYADEDRTQRHTLCLRDVAYEIVAQTVMQPGVQEDEAKYRDQFRRRVQRGQCHQMPYLGCREFSASFGTEIPASEQARLQDVTVDLGRMLFDLEYVSDQSGRGEPRFFHARLDGGVLHVPASLYHREGQ